MTQSITEKNHKPLTERERWLASQIVEIAITVHRSLGPGLLESIYEKCFCYELQKRNIAFARQQWCKIVYGQLVIEHGLQIDLLVEDLVVVEIKAQTPPQPVWEAQLLSHLRLAENLAAPGSAEMRMERSLRLCNTACAALGGDAGSSPR